MSGGCLAAGTPGSSGPAVFARVRRLVIRRSWGCGEARIETTSRLGKDGVLAAEDARSGSASRTTTSDGLGETGETD